MIAAWHRIAAWCQ